MGHPSLLSIAVQQKLSVDVATASTDSDIKSYNWCIVEYDGELYSGEVRSIDDIMMYHVSALVGSRDAWKFPDKEDIIPYARDQMNKKTGDPKCCECQKTLQIC